MLLNKDTERPMSRCRILDQMCCINSRSLITILYCYHYDGMLILQCYGDNVDNNSSVYIHAQLYTALSSSEFMSLAALDWILLAQ